MSQSVAGSIPSQGTYPGCGFDSGCGEYKRQSIDVSPSLASIFLSLFPPLSKINENMYLGEDLKRKKPSSTSLVIRGM